MVAQSPTIDLEGTSPFFFRVESAPDVALRVLSFQGQEAISRPYRFDVRLATSALDADGLTAALLGSRARLTIDVPGAEPRAVHGVVSRAWAEGVVEQDRAALKVRIVPRLWALKKRRTCRIFQDKTVPEILAALFAQAGVPHRSALHRRYQPRIYCVQHQETDFAFVERLLGEEGIFYFFEQTSDGEVLVLADNAHAYTAIAGSPELAYRWGGGDGLAVKEHHVTRFALRRGVEPSSVLHRDYDFKRPTLDLRAEQAANDIKPEHGHVYDHHGVDEAPDVGAEMAAVQLEQHRRSAALAEGHTTCRRLAPGYRFTLADHDMGELNQEYVLASVEHAGRAPEITKGREHVYEASFSCAPATVPLRPKRPKRRIQQVTETALVVGPEGEEIYTDEHGRVKVQFHWDLEGKRNEHSSCWIRVSQAWAGTHWGFQFIPRIGMEVVVTFLGGDTDRPLITGCVPNAVNPPPFKLPESKTKSGIRTRSTPKGEGHNELSFEDKRGAEELYLHAQRDLTVDVLSDHRSNVHRDRRAVVGGNQIEDVLGRSSAHVVGDVTEVLGNNHRVSVRGNRHVTIGGEDIEAVGGSRSTSVAGDLDLQVRGGLGVMVGDADDPRAGSMFAWGGLVFGAGRKVQMTAKDGIVLRCGDSALEIDKDGIKLRGKLLALEGSEGVRAAGKGPSLNLGEEVEIMAKVVRVVASKSSLLLDEEAHLDGTKVKLNCKGLDPDALDANGNPVKTRHLSLKLTSGDFTPHAKKDYNLVAGGMSFDGTTDAEGGLAHDIPEEAETAQIVVFLDQRPEGRTQRYRVNLRELPDTSSALGAQLRLKNLGYLWGEPSGELDQATSRALRAFQHDHELDETGELDGATAAKLLDVHHH